MDQGAGRPVVVGKLTACDRAELGLEAAQDAIRLGAAPAVDRLVEIAEKGQVAATLCQRRDDLVLGEVGVLDLVDLDEIEPTGPAFQHLRARREDRPDVEHQVPEIDEVPLGEAALVALGGLPGAAVFEAGARPGWAEWPGQSGSGPGCLDVLEALVDAGRLVGVVVPEAQDPPQQRHALMVVADREVDHQADLFGLSAQDLGAEVVERPQHQQVRKLGEALDDPAPKLAGGAVGEGQAEDALGRDAPFEGLGDALGQDSRLAGTGRREHEQAAVKLLDDPTLLRTECVERRRRAPAGNDVDGQLGHPGRRWDGEYIAVSIRAARRRVKRMGSG